MGMLDTFIGPLGEWDQVIPLLITCLVVGVTCTRMNIMSWVVNKSTEAAENANRLLPTGGGVHVWWWSIFQQSRRNQQHSSNHDKHAMLHRTLSSIGRFALRSQTKQNPSIISFFVALSNENGTKELDLKELKQLVQDRVVANHERFQSRICSNDDRFFEVSLDYIVI